MHLDEGTIHAWLDGALDADEAARVEQHAAECAQCASAVAEARGLVAGASRILAALDDVPSGVAPKSPAFAGTARATPRPRSLWRVLHLTPYRAAAAAVLIVAAGTVLVMRRGAPNEGAFALAKFPHDSATVVMRPRMPVSATPVPPPVSVNPASVDTVAVTNPRPARRVAASRTEVAEAAPSPTPAPSPANQAAPSPNAPLDKKSTVAEERQAQVASSVADSLRDRGLRGDNARARDSSARQPSLAEVVATSAVARAPAAIAPPRAGVAGAAAPEAKSLARAQVQVRPLLTPVAGNYAGCYAVSGQSASADLGALPSVLSLDSARVPRTAEALAQERMPSFAISAIGDGSRRPIESASWQPLPGQRGIRLSVEGRAPIVFAGSGDSLLSAPPVILRRVNCPTR